MVGRSSSTTKARTRVSGRVKIRIGARVMLELAVVLGLESG